jgi:hypothetical protein
MQREDKYNIWLLIILKLAWWCFDQQVIVLQQYNNTQILIVT